MKQFLVTAALLAGLAMPVAAQEQCPKEFTMSRVWSQGFNALPDVCTNLAEFQRQYKLNQKQWDAMFAWLAKTDLTAIPAGRHPIEGSNLTASVEDSENQPLEKCGTESHYTHIDMQYVVKGTERFGLLDHKSSRPNCGYRDDVIHYDYKVEKTTFIDSAPGRFFLFFPSDWHIAKVQSPLSQDQKIRVVVVKLDYIE